MSSPNNTDPDPPVSTAIIETVAETAGVDPTALPPLYEYVDVDAIESVFESPPDGPTRTGIVRFSYDGHVVTVEFDEDIARSIHVEPADVDPAP